MHHTTATASKRLLREARAMAKLSHPNVMTVHDVGTADGQDFVAMELVDGETLSQWLRAEPRGTREIVAAFLAAGRGLAAAHAAGMIHRDFKPQNVMRSVSGRILVADFGLARATDSNEPEGDASPRASWAELTATGAVLGTPAYMAPEQWKAGVITPASDQFAYCVSLWEALAGARPFLADDTEALYAKMLEGPATLDDAKIPRALRPILRRGLLPAAGDRWPSMDALLAQIERVTRRRTLTIGATVAVGIAASLAYPVLRDLGSSPAASPCPATSLDPAVVWNDARAKTIAALGSDAAKILAADFAAWKKTRDGVCAAPKVAMSAKLACLDAVLARFHAIVLSAEIDKQPLLGGDIAEVLVEPSLCARTNPPRVLAEYRDDMDRAFSDLRAAHRGVLPSKSPDAPCPRAVTAIARATAVAAMHPLARPHELPPFDATDAAAKCDDDFFAALAAIGEAEGDNIKTIEPAAAAAEVVPQTDITAEIDLLHARLELSAERWDLAIANAKSALDGFVRRGRTRRQVASVLVHLDALSHRGTRADLEAIAPLVAEWRAIDSDFATDFDHFAAQAAWRLGDVKAARAIYLEGGAHRAPERGSHALVQTPVVIVGKVVDPDGRSVAGATVVGGGLAPDGAGLAMPRLSHGLTMTKTDATGRFSLAVDGRIAAEHGALRSRIQTPAADMTIALEATSRVEGHVALGDRAFTDVFVLIGETAAPVDANGRFAVDNIPRGELRAKTRDYWHNEFGVAPKIIVDGPVVTGVELTAPATERLWVIARPVDMSNPASARIYIRYGEHPTSTIADGFRVVEEAKPPPIVDALPKHVRDLYKPDDFVAQIRGREPGVLTACAAPVLENRRDALNCVIVPTDQNVVVVELPVVRRK